VTVALAAPAAVPLVRLLRRDQPADVGLAPYGAAEFVAEPPPQRGVARRAVRALVRAACPLPSVGRVRPSLRRPGPRRLRHLQPGPVRLRCAVRRRGVMALVIRPRRAGTGEGRPVPAQGRAPRGL